MSARPIVAASLKTYFGHEDTLHWVRGIVDASRPWLDRLDVIVMPMPTALADVATIIRGTGILLGAQDCSWTPPGPYTGEVTAVVLRELGVEVVELGHAERRRLFGDDDAVVARKVAIAADAGLIPMICVGEPVDGPPAAATKICLEQVEVALAALPAGQPVVVAYEPVWAIGAAEPAGPPHIRSVCRELKAYLRATHQGSRVVYGGTAGPGLFASVHRDVDGLFLGRRAHEPAAFAAVLQEVQQAMSGPSADRVQGLEMTR